VSLCSRVGCIRGLSVACHVADSRFDYLDRLRITARLLNCASLLGGRLPPARNILLDLTMCSSPMGSSLKKTNAGREELLFAQRELQSWQPRQLKTAITRLARSLSQRRTVEFSPPKLSISSSSPGSPSCPHKSSATAWRTRRTALLDANVDGAGDRSASVHELGSC